MAIILNVIKDGVTVEHGLFHTRSNYDVEIYAKNKYPDFHSSLIGNGKIEVFLKGNKNPSIMDLLNRN